ncbi:hypothetical protein NONI108955_18885 [Nocardia ninae]|uniref:Tetratricopeptide repeat protein n=1 Tax=Nocardia ninae NBRC 108245 TaxID=1210091 RepID=A0A511MQJ6_9NOCA|nr:hypothetical protein [Nocardia ninae]GEM42276.1 hypothetical protein NN4_67950 [Nocardia ninae NBRC 108245]
MDTAEINEALAQVYSLPHGRLRVERLEMLAAAAKSATDRHLEGRVLLELAESYTYAGERDLAPVAYGRLLRIYDEFPAELGSLTHSVHWYLKWMTWGLIDNPAVPPTTVYRWFDELENRYRQRGYSLRPVLALRAELARKLGDAEHGALLHEEAMAAPRDGMSDCDACERNEWGTGRAALGDDAGALAHWQPVIDGDRVCAEEPHRVLAQALLPLLRTGRVAEARGAHLTGYPLVRHNDSLRPSVALHIEFCALTGNEGRGLEILAEHARWLTDPGADAGARLAFITGVCVLLRRLDTLGLGYLPIAGGTVNSLLAELDTEIAGLCARYDIRNGNAAVSTRVTARLARQPLLERLPLGLRSRLPGVSAGCDAADGAAATFGATSGQASTGGGAPAGGGIEGGSGPDSAVRTGDGTATIGVGSMSVAGSAGGVGSASGSVLADSAATGVSRTAVPSSGEWAADVTAEADRRSEARRLAELGAARLADAPEQAEARLREALTIGSGVLPAEHLARVSSQLVIAIAGQPDRELDLADAAVRAAARWEGLSEPDLLHHTVIAARAFHRGRRHGEAVALFEEALAANGVPYPPAELATVRAQFGESLNALHRYDDAARQFALGAQLVEHDPERRALHAQLAMSAAAALDYSDHDAAAVAAYQRAAELFGELGDVVSRARCVRSAAWLQLWGSTAGPGRPWFAAMQALIAELAELDGGSSSNEVAEELARARRELTEMLDAEDRDWVAGE